MKRFGSKAQNDTNSTMLHQNYSNAKKRISCKQKKEKLLIGAVIGR